MADNAHSVKPTGRCVTCGFEAPIADYMGNQMDRHCDRTGHPRYELVLETRR
jgi:hypothetical protein